MMLIFFLTVEGLNIYITLDEITYSIKDIQLPYNCSVLSETKRSLNKTYVYPLGSLQEDTLKLLIKASLWDSMIFYISFSSK